MNDLLFQCLKEERSIFRDFNSFRDIGAFQVFSSPGLSEIPHWNLAYPKDIRYLTANTSELMQIASFYKSQSLTGHLLSTDVNVSRSFSEESEYFMLRNNLKIATSSLAHEMTHTEHELNQFSKLVQTSFSLSNSTAEYFYEKMSILKTREDSKFYIIKLQNEVIGGCSTFKTESGATFLFNVATHPNAQRTGIAKYIVTYASQKSPKPLYTYSHNPIVRDSILPSLGFVSIGTIWCRPIETFL